jgi:serine/threonine protein kinase
MHSNTIRSDLDPTVAEPSAKQALLADAIVSQWSRSGQPDMVAVLREHPSLLWHRSLLLNLAIEEYEAIDHASGDVDLDKHCARFEEFGSSIQQSILRQLEVQRFIDRQPDLLRDLCTPQWPKPGEDFGPFYVLEEIGFGAIARVYICLESELGNRSVVVKATPLPTSEASILGKLNHENIIPIYATGRVEERDLYYLSMPYCGRSTLADLVDIGFQEGCPRHDRCVELAASRWTSEEKWLSKKSRRPRFAFFRDGTYVDGVLKLATQIADALEYAHQQKIVHGDLKPSNVLLTPDGKPLLLDFNLSQDFARRPAICGGTLPYMPPEQLEFVAEQLADDEKPIVDVMSDIYSFGALLYELLTGVTPVHDSGRNDDPAATARLFLARIKEGIPPIRNHNRLVSARLEAIIMRCLSWDKRRRPATIGKVKAALQNETRPLPAIRRQARVRPVLFSAVAGLPLLILSGAGAYIAVQPPRYLANYEEGLRLASKGELEKASACFGSATHYSPSFRPARFQLGRTQIALGAVDLALNEFTRLARDDKDPRAMAYLGYCFNMKRLSIAAIPWYEQAIQNGCKSTAVYNNLGASILEGSTTGSRSKQLDQAEHYLSKALESGESQSTIQLNLLRHAVAKSQTDSSYNPFDVWHHAQHLGVTYPNDAFIDFHIAIWYDAVQSYEIAMARHSSKPEIRFSDVELAARKHFKEIYNKIKSSNPESLLRFTPDANQSSGGVQRYYLEPVAPEGALS